jgi:hypothetical protein
MPGGGSQGGSVGWDARGALVDGGSDNADHHQPSREKDEVEDHHSVYRIYRRAKVARSALGDLPRETRRRAGGAQID